MGFIVPHFETNPITSYTAWFSERDSPLILIILNIVGIIPNLSSINHRLSGISLRSQYFHGKNMLKTFKNPYEMTYQPTRAKKISHCWYGGPQFDQLHLEHHQRMVETPRDGLSIDPQNSPTHLYLI